MARELAFWEGPAGIVFTVNLETVEEALDTLLFGMPKACWGIVERIDVGTPIFLCDLEHGVMHGCFEAVTHGCYNLDPLAYGGNRQHGSRLPSQVQVDYHYKFIPVPLWEFQRVPALFLDGGLNIDRTLTEEQVEEMYYIFNKALEKQRRQADMYYSGPLCYLPLPDYPEPVSVLPIPPEPPEFPLQSSSSFHSRSGKRGGQVKSHPPVRHRSAPKKPALKNSCKQSPAQRLPEESDKRDANTSSKRLQSLSCSENQAQTSQALVAVRESAAKAGVSLNSDLEGPTMVSSRNQLPSKCWKLGNHVNDRQAGINCKLVERGDTGSNTTVMLTNISEGLTPDLAVDSLDQNGFFGAYDFLMLKPAIKAKPGSLLINMVSRERAEAVFKEINAITAFWPPLKNKQANPVRWSKLQGLEELSTAYKQNFYLPGVPGSWSIPQDRPVFFKLPSAAELQELQRKAELVEVASRAQLGSQQLLQMYEMGLEGDAEPLEAQAGATGQVISWYGGKVGAGAARGVVGWKRSADLQLGAKACNKRLKQSMPVRDLAVPNKTEESKVDDLECRLNPALECKKVQKASRQPQQTLSKYEQPGRSKTAAGVVLPQDLCTADHNSHECGQVHQPHVHCEGKADGTGLQTGTPNESAAAEKAFALARGSVFEGEAAAEQPGTSHGNLDRQKRCNDQAHASATIGQASKAPKHSQIVWNPDVAAANAAKQLQMDDLNDPGAGEPQSGKLAQFSECQKMSLESEGFATDIACGRGTGGLPGGNSSLEDKVNGIAGKNGAMGLTATTTFGEAQGREEVQLAMQNGFEFGADFVTL